MMPTSRRDKPLSCLPVWFLVGCIGWLSPASACAADAKTLKTAGLPLVPKGVHLGIELSRFRQVRPKAFSLSEMGFFNAKPSKKRPKRTPQEKETWIEMHDLSGSQPGDNRRPAPKGPVPNVEKLLNRRERKSTAYLFEKKKCVAILGEHLSTSWALHVRARRRHLAKCISVLGTGFRRIALRLKGWQMSYLAPALVWEDDEKRVVVSFTPDFTELRLDQGQVRIRVTPKTRKPPTDRTLTPRDRERIFKVVDEVLEEVKAGRWTDFKKRDAEDEPGADKTPAADNGAGSHAGADKTPGAANERKASKDSKPPKAPAADKEKSKSPDEDEEIEFE